MRGAGTSAVAKFSSWPSGRSVRNGFRSPTWVLYKGALCQSCDGAMRTLFTIGYEKAKPDAVLGELKRAKVDLLIDTRAVAASRRPGFSKRQLSASLDDAGIGYLHLQKLGTPAEGRQAARAGDRETLWRIYEKHIKKPEPQAELGALADLVRSGQRIALLCYCRDPKTCHRWVICTHLEKRL